MVGEKCYGPSHGNTGFWMEAGVCISRGGYQHPPPPLNPPNGLHGAPLPPAWPSTAAPRSGPPCRLSGGGARGWSAPARGACVRPDLHSPHSPRSAAADRPVGAGPATRSAGRRGAAHGWHAACNARRPDRVRRAEIDSERDCLYRPCAIWRQLPPAQAISGLLPKVSRSGK